MVNDFAQELKGHANQACIWRLPSLKLFLKVLCFSMRLKHFGYNSQVLSYISGFT